MSLGSRWPVSRVNDAIFSAISPAPANSGLSVSIRTVNGCAAVAWLTISPHESSGAASRLSSWAIQRPVQFSRWSTVPSAPRSFAMFSDSASGEVTGSSRTVPTSDHVPQEMKRVSSSIGTLATALAVSWPQTVTSGISVPSASAKVPRLVPSSSISRSRAAGILKWAVSSTDHSPAVVSSCVVDAMLGSQPSAPVSR